MLRRADNVRATYVPHLTGRGFLVLQVGDDHIRVKRLDKTGFHQLFVWAAMRPQMLALVGGCGCWIYRGAYFWDNQRLQQKEVQALLDQRLAVVPDGSYPKLRVAQGTDRR